MRHLSEYVAVNPDLFRPEQVLGVNLHIFMPLNRNVVFFRRTGDVLTSDDHAKIAQLPKNTLLVHRSEREMVYSPVAEELPKVVENVIGALEKTPSVQAYEAVLKHSRTQAENSIMAHNEQVSAIAVLIRLTAGGDPLLLGKVDSPEDLAHVGAAGLLHDLGLLSIPGPVAKKHLIGEDELTVSEKMVYMKHLEGSLALAEKSKPHVNADVLIAISHPANSFGFHQALAHLNWKERQAGIFAYDPAIMAALGELH